LREKVLKFYIQWRILVLHIIKAQMAKIKERSILVQVHNSPSKKLLKWDKLKTVRTYMLSINTNNKMSSFLHTLETLVQLETTDMQNIQFHYKELNNSNTEKLMTESYNMDKVVVMVNPKKNFTESEQS